MQIHPFGVIMNPKERDTMFCPNCGKDCADANFCSMCGTRIREAETTEAACSAGTTSSQTDTQEDSYEFPVGSFSSCIGDHLKLHNHSLSMVSRIIFQKKNEILIPYDQLHRIVLARPKLGKSRFGYILFRYEGNKEIPIPELKNFGQDKTKLFIEEEKVELVYHIFCVLKTVAPASAKFSILSPSMTEDRLKKLTAEVDMDACFERFSPYRDRAVEYVCNAAHAQAQEARILVDTVFDARQAEIYAENPKLAIRDLNRIIADEKRKAEEKKRESQERANKRSWFLFFRL